MLLFLQVLGELVRCRLEPLLMFYRFHDEGDGVVDTVVHYSCFVGNRCCLTKICFDVHGCRTGAGY